VQFVAKLLAAERRHHGTPRRSRALTCFCQAVLGLRWFRDRTTPDALARDHGISRATTCRYRDEVTGVLAGRPRPQPGAGTSGGTTAHWPLAGTPAHHPQAQQDRRRRPYSPGPHPFRTRSHHVNFAGITSLCQTCALAHPAAGTALSRPAIHDQLQHADGIDRATVALKLFGHNLINGK
jgi:hypothetical protein